MGDGTKRPESGTPLSIPDGGLGSTLPDWMQEKPGWTDRLPAATPTVQHQRPAVDPETTPIDLSQILDVDDLPEWLRVVATRSSRAGHPASVADEVTQPETEPMSSRSSVSADEPTSGEQPWWASDRAMAILLVAVILTILFVLITTVRLQ